MFEAGSALEQGEKEVKTGKSREDDGRKLRAYCD
jgi:hypothetical protein